MVASDERNTVSPERAKFVVAVESTSFLGDGALPEYESPYQAISGLQRALEEKEICALIDPGGLSITLNQQNVGVAAEILADFGIDITSLEGETFQRQLFRAGSLAKLFAINPTGKAATILAKLVEDRN